MVPDQLSPISNRLSVGVLVEIPRHFKPIGGGAIAEVEDNTATAGIEVVKIKPYKQSIADGILNVVVVKLRDQPQIVDIAIAPSYKGADPTFQRQSCQITCGPQSVSHVDIRSWLDRLLG